MKIDRALRQVKRYLFEHPVTDIKVLSTKTLYTGKVVDLVEDQVQHPDGRVFTHATVNHPGAVVILPLLPENRLIMVHQYRHSMGRYLFEFPAGTLRRGEDPLDCAKREIEEEVGQSAAEWINMGILYPAPGFCNEVQHLFLARELTKTEPNLDDDEILVATEKSLEEFEAMIVDGTICDAKTLAVFLRARVRGLV